MFRFLFRLVVLLIVIGAIGVFAVSNGWLSGIGERTEAEEPLDTDRIRERGAEIAERVAEGATKAEAVLSEAGLTAKIRSKIALDDTLDGADVSVDTEGTIVTVKGTVLTGSQRERVVQLARETEGVTSVVNRIEVNAR